MMRKSVPKTHQESASDLVASDAHSSEADFQHKQGDDLRINGHQDIADGNGNSPQSSHPFCAQKGLKVWRCARHDAITLARTSQRVLLVQLFRFC
jgi:hypothetical protein